MTRTNTEAESGIVWVRDNDWVRLPSPRRCRCRGKDYATCKNSAEFGLKRRNGLWAYCEEHMYGRRIRNGIVEVQVWADSPAVEKMEDNRLLTLVEMSKAITERRQVLELNGHTPTAQDERCTIAMAQAVKTRAEIIKEIKTWLDHHAAFWQDVLAKGKILPFLTAEDYQNLYGALGQGKMPEEE